MKNYLILLALGFVGLAGCSKHDSSCGFKESTITAPQPEQTALADSLQKYNLPAIAHPSGIYYQIVSQGTSNTDISLCSNVSASYWGGFFNGSGFDSSEAPVTFTLGQVIVGWQKAIPMLKGVGEMNIYIPPTLGYGSRNVSDQSGRVVIPGNSYLVFKVKVTAID